jgi:hypothetical protein
METDMHTKTLLILAALAAAPMPAFAASSAGGPELSCDMVHANPSWFSRKAVAECRHASALEPMGYAAGMPGRSAPTGNSSCADVRYFPGNYSADIRASCGASAPYGGGDWGGSLVR